MNATPLARVTGTLLLTVFMVLTLVFAVQGSFETRAQIASTFARQSQIQQAQIDLEELQRLQIDEENSLRGYSLTRDPFYVAQYRQAVAGYDAKESAIRGTLREQQLVGVAQLLGSYAHLQSEWRKDVAAPLSATRVEDRVEPSTKRNKTVLRLRNGDGRGNLASGSRLLDVTHRRQHAACLHRHRSSARARRSGYNRSRPARDSLQYPIAPALSRARGRASDH